MNFATRPRTCQCWGVLTSGIELEDDLGDILEKALRRAGWNEEQLAQAARVPVGKISDAVAYRSELTVPELQRLAAALDLNEVGLSAVACGRYPLPEISPLAFQVWPLRMRHGIGVANAYVVAEPGADHGLLFDSGAGLDVLEQAWPPAVRRVDAIFLTHVESEHAGGLCAVIHRFGIASAFIPRGAVAPCGSPLGEGDRRVVGNLQVTAFTTPGHAAAHNCYVVQQVQARPQPGLLISGDLVFAGSVGGGYFCPTQVQNHVRRILEGLPGATVIAPGHGPMTTVGHELRFNPFVP